MKFLFGNKGQLGLILSLSVLVTSCNPEEYFPVEELVEGADAYCAQSTDSNSCQSLATYCQPAYSDLELDTEEPLFVACLANPDLWEDHGSSADPNDGSNDVPVIDTPPSIQETIAAKCENLDAKYMLVKKELKKKQVISTSSKVKVCHETGNGSSHTVVIACPALKAHKQHNDYIGACQQ